MSAQLELNALAQREISRIRTLPQPVVRVCGPLTCDGPERYHLHADRLTAAEAVLTARGMSVWCFGVSEQEIIGKGYDPNDIFIYFHLPVLSSGLISTAYFLPRSGESEGARKERTKCLELGISIEEFPEAWFLCAS